MFTAELLEGWLNACKFSPDDVPFAKRWLPSIAKLLNAYGEKLKVSSDESVVKYMLQYLGHTLRTSKPPRTRPS
jgi:hypothetical protein